MIHTSTYYRNKSTGQWIYVLEINIEDSETLVFCVLADSHTNIEANKFINEYEILSVRDVLMSHRKF